MQPWNETRDDGGILGGGVRAAETPPTQSEGGWIIVRSTNERLMERDREIENG